jgi:hypothetical protein
MEKPSFKEIPASTWFNPLSETGLLYSLISRLLEKPTPNPAEKAFSDPMPLVAEPIANAPKNAIGLAFNNLGENASTLLQYSGQIYGYLAGTRIPPLLNERIKEAESCILPLSLKKCPEYCSYKVTSIPITITPPWYGDCRVLVKLAAKCPQPSSRHSIAIAPTVSRT